MYSHPSHLHLVYMAKRQREKRVQPRFKPPVLRRTHIRDWREFRGRTLEETAEAIGPHLPDGITHATLSRMERGLIPYNQRQLEALAGYLETTIAALLERKPGDGEFWTTFEKLPQEQKDDIAKYTEYVAERAQKTGT